MPWKTLAVLALAGALGSCWIAERAAIFRPAKDGPVDPRGWGLPAEPVRVTAEDGIALAAWWIPHADPAAPAVIVFQGRRGLRWWYGRHTRTLWERGLSVMLFDYRGYGASEGHPTEWGLIRDGTAVYDWVRRRVGERPVILYGRSLGGAVAAQTALRREAQGLVLESTFTSIPEMARAMTGVPGIGYLVATQLDTAEAVARLDVPLMVVHGTADPLVPFEMGQALYERAASRHKTLHAVEGASHWNAYYLAGRDYADWFDDLIAQVRREDRLARNAAPPQASRGGATPPAPAAAAVTRAETIPAAAAVTLAERPAAAARRLPPRGRVLAGAEDGAGLSVRTETSPLSRH